MLILYNGCYQDVSKEEIAYMENKGIKFDILDKYLRIAKEVNNAGKNDTHSRK